MKFSNKILISSEAKDFIAGLLVKTPCNRLGTTADSLEIMNHPWFRDFDWAKLLDKSLTPPYNPMFLGFEEHFDPIFTSELAKDSICLDDPVLFKIYEKKFIHFNESDDELSTKVKTQNTKLDQLKIYNIENLIHLK